MPDYSLRQCPTASLPGLRTALQYSVCAATLLLCQFAFAQMPFADVQRSHIEANVPPEGEFNTLLHRDLLAYFDKQGMRGASDLTFELLREGPTQSGVAYPKYYLWVRVLVNGKTLTEGAVRVAAIERTHFEVTDFLTGDSIRADSERLNSIFPAALYERIVAKANGMSR